MFSDKRRFWLLAFVLISTACRSGTQSGPDRVALIPFDNQSPDAEAQWAGEGIAQLAVAQLAGAPTAAYFVAADSAEAVRNRATHMVQGYWTGGVSTGNLELHGELRTVAGIHSRSLTVKASSPSAVAHGLAIALWPQAPGSPTAPTGALRLYIEGGRNRNAAQLEESIAAAPDFGPARFSLGQLQTIQGDRAAAKETFGQATARPSLDALSRARCAVASASDPASRLAALEALTLLTPAHAESFVQAGSAALAFHRFDRAARLLGTSTQLDPGAAIPWNELGYALAFSGDRNGALAKIREYGKLAPDSANPLDSLGEVYFLHGDFAEAEQAFLDAYTKDPGLLRAVTLRKAAVARMLAGDAAQANLIFERYKDAMAKHPLAPLLAIQWKYSSGDKAGAIAAVLALATGSRSSYAWAQGALWLAAEKEFDRAAAAATQARAAARSANEAAGALVAGFIAQPDAPPAEWTRRAEGVHPSVRSRALAWALLMHGHFAEAATQLEQASAGATLSEYSQFQALAGHAWLQAGDKAKAKKLLALWPLPSSDGNLFDSMVFPAVGEWKQKL
ncbi:MAG: hypothetical protein R2762_13820 [Bryobacteraceae bacterium]